MTTLQDGLLLYLKLDGMTNGKLLDQSGQGNAGTVQGNPQIVVDDTFGHALSFDGQHDSFTLSGASIPTGNQVTASVWLYGADTLPQDSVVVQAVNAASVRTLNMHVPWGDGTVYFDCGTAGTDYDRISQAAQPTDYKGAWVHWVFLKDVSTGEMHIYRNGSHWLGGTGMVRPIPASTGVTVGSNYPGKMAHLRIYNRVLSAEEIVQLRGEDETALASFRRIYPLDFNLHNDDDESVLYIVDQPGGYNLHLDVTNASGRALQLQQTTNQVASPTNYHLALRFRPGVLSLAFESAATALLDTPRSLADWTAVLATAAAAVSAVASATDWAAALSQAASAAMARRGVTKIPGESAESDTVDATQWSTAADVAADGATTLYLLSTAALTLQPNLTQKVTLPGLSANGLGGARGTRVEVLFQNLVYPDDSTPIQGRRILHLGILNREGQKVIPLHIGFTGSNTILNDGKLANSLTLRISNVLNAGSIALSPANSPDPSRFILSFDVQDTAAKEWALGTASEVSAIQITPSDRAWSVAQQTQGESPEWIVTTQAVPSLGPGEAIELNLANIITSLPTGQSTLYLRYENIPGYWDGQMVTTIDKSPLLFRGSDIVWGNQSVLRSDQGGSIELGGNSGTAGVGTPYIDFHFNGKDQDYNTRIINSADGELQLEALSVKTTGDIVVSGNLRGNTASFSGNVTWSNQSRLQNDQGGSIELGGNNGTAGVGTPYIDFHFNGKAQDFNTRIINSADGELQINAQKLIATGDVAVTGALRGGGATFSGPISLGGDNTIQQGINFQQDNVPVHFQPNMTWFAHVPSSNAIRIKGGDGGVLAVKDYDVLLWGMSSTSPGKGNVLVKGILAATDKWFRIEHPTKPDHELIHACLEGPESAVYYRGQGRLEDGRASVELPAYFEALTRREGRTVQLTARGREPYLLSYDDVVDGSFHVFGTRLNGEFSWEVKAVRADVSRLETEVRK